KIECDNHGSRLAVVHGEQEDTFLYNLWISSRDEIRVDRYPWANNVSLVYIGLSDTNGDGEYEWIDNSPLSYVNWGKEQPSGGAENAVSIWDWPEQEGTWNDVNGKSDGFTGPFICEMRAT
ncbi:lectin-like protein, partial [Salmonella sp. s51944]|uniref:lectin-like protein n=1 Tax=Salmonella sp. s51944 TaxID=3159655 RepID=UPI0039807210